MKKIVIALLATSVMGVASAATALKTEDDKLSYSIGSDLGNSFKSQQIQIKPDVFLQGLTDAMGGKKPLLSKDEMKQTIQAFQKKLLMKRIAQYKKSADKNKEKGTGFLQKNKSKPGVVTTASGLQYKVLETGKGTQSPTKEDSVTVEYTGKLLNGKVFDTTEGKDKPATFKLTQVIPGWTEALQKMKAGDKWEIYVPSNLAYGPRGIGGPIGPNETLIFKIKLISIQKKTKA